MATKSISLRIPVELFKKVEDAKWKTRKSINAIIVECLEAGINKVVREEGKK